jgi:hypothetical protein
MEKVMKKSLVLVAMLAFATTLFAETITCESKRGGTCTYELSGETLSKTCTCKDGTTVEGTETATALPTEEECKQEARTVCQSQQDPGQPGQPGSGLTCKNDAGRCSVEEESGNYNCICSGTQEQKTGTTANISEEGCTAVLEEECGTEAPLLSSICTEKEVFDTCASYTKAIANKCSDNPVTDEEIEAMFNAPVSGSTAKEISRCCQMEQMREEQKTSFECIEAAGTCENKECCESCVKNNMPPDGDPNNPPDSTDTEDGDTDAGDTGSDGDTDTANTDAPADDETPTDSETPADKTDGDDTEAPATDSEAENQKESKSDGCSMLFI